jgi:hypothetical protein
MLGCDFSLKTEIEKKRDLRESKQSEHKEKKVFEEPVRTNIKGKRS